MGPNTIARPASIETYGGGGDRVLGFASEALGNTLHFMSKHNRTAQRLFFITLGALGLAGCGSANARVDSPNVGSHIPAAQATAFHTTQASVLGKYLDCPDKGALLRGGPKRTESGDLGSHGTLVCIYANGAPAPHAPVISKYYDVLGANGIPHGDKAHDAEMTAYCTSADHPAGTGWTPDIQTSQSGNRLEVNVTCGVGNADFAFNPVYA